MKRLWGMVAAAALAAGPVEDAARLLRSGKTTEARALLAAYVKASPDDAEGWFQLARTHLADQARGVEPRVAVDLAIEALGAALKRNPNHVYALQAKSVLHARAELLHYDPNLAYALAQRVVKLQPFANPYLLQLSEWMTGEVRFTEHSGHRVPHDPALGIDRSLPLIERVMHSALPYSEEEGAALFLMGKALGRRGDHAASLEYFQQALTRARTVDQKREVLRELGAGQFRAGQFEEAAASFYEGLQAGGGWVDRWLLRVAAERMKRPPQLPASAQFPLAVAARPEISFTDIAPRLGIDRLDGNGTCGWADYDGDGDLDLFLAGSGTFLAVYRNEGVRFQEATAEAGLAQVPSSYSLNLIDFDNDGRVDLYLSYNGWNGPMENRLYRNTGGRFEAAPGHAGDPGSGFVSLWGDLDGDGDLDLAVANGVLRDGSTPQVYRNDGGGKFTNMTRAAGIVEPPSYGAIGIALGDYDRDGDLDLLINGLDDTPNRLYRNEGGWRFQEVAKQAGVTQPRHNGFVCFFFDYNNDGLPDILTTSLAPWDAVVEGLRPGYRPVAPHPDSVRLFRNRGNGSFVDVTMEAGLFYPMGVMGAGVADIDNDGYLDIYFGTGDPQLSRLEPNRLFRNTGRGGFEDITFSTPLARPGAKGHGVTFVDIDGDGDLDIYAQLGGHYQGDHARNALYENRSGKGNHWLQLDGLPVGAQVTAGGQYREVKGSEGFGATDPMRVHFGLGAAEQVAEVRIRRPDGKVTVLRNVKADQVLRVAGAPAKALP